MENLSENSGSFIELVYDFYKTMKNHKVILIYEGFVTHEIVKAFSSLTEANIEREEEDANTQKKVFYVLVECLQNISKHSDSSDMEFGKGVFIVSQAEDKYMITTGNTIDNVKIDGLQKMLDNINSLDQEGIKQLYKTQMREGSLSEKGGAGLGFISIVKKTGEKLVYSFLPIDDTKSFFILNSTVSRKSNKI